MRLRPAHSDGEGFTFELRDAFGTTSGAFAETQLRLISRTVGSRKRKADMEAINAVIALVDGARPDNEVEAAVAIQLGLSHHIACELLARAVASQQVEHMERYLNLATKLQRTMAAHAETLSGLRRGADQSVEVNQVTVKEGGQAIVGPVTVNNHAENGG